MKSSIQFTLTHWQIPSISTDFIISSLTYFYGTNKSPIEKHTFKHKKSKSTYKYWRNHLYITKLYTVCSTPNCIPSNGGGGSVGVLDDVSREKEPPTE